MWFFHLFTHFWPFFSLVSIKIPLNSQWQKMTVSNFLYFSHILLVILDFFQNSAKTKFSTFCVPNYAFIKISYNWYLYGNYLFFYTFLTLFSNFSGKPLLQHRWHHLTRCGGGRWGCSSYGRTCSACTAWACSARTTRPTIARSARTRTRTVRYTCPAVWGEVPLAFPRAKIHQHPTLQQRWIEHFCFQFIWLWLTDFFFQHLCWFSRVFFSFFPHSS